MQTTFKKQFCCHIIHITAQFTHLRCTAQWFCIFSELCDHQHNLILEHFFTPKVNSMPISSQFPSPHIPRLRYPLTYFLSLWTLHINGIIQYKLFYNWLLSLKCVTFLRFIHVVTRVSYSFVFYCWIIVHWMNRPHFTCPFISWWTFGLFLLFGYYK